MMTGGHESLPPGEERDRVKTAFFEIAAFEARADVALDLAKAVANFEPLALWMGTDNRDKAMNAMLANLWLALP